MVSGWSLSACVCAYVCVYESVSARPADDGWGLSQRHYRFILTFVWDEAAQGSSLLRAFQHSVPRYVHTHTHIHIQSHIYMVFVSILNGQWSSCSSRGWALVEIFHGLLSTSSSLLTKVFLLIHQQSGIHLFNIQSNTLQLAQPCLSVSQPAYSSGCFVQLWPQKSGVCMCVRPVCLCSCEHDVCVLLYIHKEKVTCVWELVSFYL